MFSITLICMGKLKERFYTEAAAEYAKRLKAYCDFQLIELPECRLPEDPNDAQIAQVGRVVVRIARKTHVGAGEAQARIEAAPERCDDGNSEEAPKRMGD